MLQEKDLCISMRKKGYTIEEIARKCKAEQKDVYDVLKKNLGQKYLEFNIEMDETNETKIQDMLYGRLIELITEYYPKYTIPLTKQKYIIISREIIGKNIGVEIRATYYDSVIKSLWAYKKYNQKVDQLFIIVISRRLTGEKIREMNNDKEKPKNVHIIDYRDKKKLEKLYQKLWEKITDIAH